MPFWCSFGSLCDWCCSWNSVNLTFFFFMLLTKTSLLNFPIVKRQTWMQSWFCSKYILKTFSVRHTNGFRSCYWRLPLCVARVCLSNTHSAVKLILHTQHNLFHACFVRLFQTEGSVEERGGSFPRRKDITYWVVWETTEGKSWLYGIIIISRYLLPYSFLLLLLLLLLLIRWIYVVFVLLRKGAA